MIDGEISEVSLKNYRGQYVILFFYPKVHQSALLLTNVETLVPNMAARITLADACGFRTLHLCVQLRSSPSASGQSSLSSSTANLLLLLVTLRRPTWLGSRPLARREVLVSCRSPSWLTQPRYHVQAQLHICARLSCTSLVAQGCSSPWDSMCACLIADYSCEHIHTVN